VLKQSEKNFGRLLLQHGESLLVSQLAGVRFEFESAEAVPMRSLDKMIQLRSPRDSIEEGSLSLASLP